MNEAQQLMDAFNDLEQEMQKFKGLASKVLEHISNQEFVPEKVNTDMMQSIIELNKKEKDCFQLYNDMKVGDAIPNKRDIMKSQIEKRMVYDKKADYLNAVKKSFNSLYSEDKEVDDILKSYKEKISSIQLEKYSIDQCLVYVKPFAVFLCMIKEDDPVKSIERVPVLIEYFGSELVAHITVVKDIHIGEDAEDFSMSDVEQESDDKAENSVSEPVEPADFVMTDAAVANVVPVHPEPAAVPPSYITPVDSVNIAPEHPSAASSDEDVTDAEGEEDRTLSKELEHIKREEAKKDAERKKIEARRREEEKRREEERLREEERKENLKALLEEEGFKESKLDDQELKDMQEKNKKRKWFH